MQKMVFSHYHYLFLRSLEKFFNTFVLGQSLHLHHTYVVTEGCVNECPLPLYSYLLVVCSLLSPCFLKTPWLSFLLSVSTWEGRRAHTIREMICRMKERKLTSTFWAPQSKTWRKAVGQ